VLASARVRRAGISAASLRRAEDQFALYLAGLAFRCGAHARAVAWGLRALRSGVAFEILPYVVRGLSPALARGARPQRRAVSPGTRFGEWAMPEAPIPYDRIYGRRFPHVVPLAR
jgi:hypothetical protein